MIEPLISQTCAQLLISAIPYVGASLTLFAWAYSKINTKNFSLQVFYILFFITWIMYSLADDKNQQGVAYYSLAIRFVTLGILASVTYYAYKTTIILNTLKRDLEERNKNKAVLQHEYIPVINQIIPEMNSSIVNNDNNNK